MLLADPNESTEITGLAQIHCFKYSRSIKEQRVGSLLGATRFGQFCMGLSVNGWDKGASECVRNEIWMILATFVSFNMFL